MLKPCHSLELNVRQLILSDLAFNIGEVRKTTDSDNVLSAIDLITSRVETRALEDDDNSEQPHQSDNEEQQSGDMAEQRVFMVCIHVFSTLSNHSIVPPSPIPGFNATLALRNWLSIYPALMLKIPSLFSLTSCAIFHT